MGHKAIPGNRDSDRKVGVGPSAESQGSQLLDSKTLDWCANLFFVSKDRFFC